MDKYWENNCALVGPWRGGVRRGVTLSSEAEAGSTRSRSRAPIPGPASALPSILCFAPRGGVAGRYPSRCGGDGSRLRGSPCERRCISTREGACFRGKAAFRTRNTHAGKAALPARSPGPRGRARRGPRSVPPSQEAPGCASGWRAQSSSSSSFAATAGSLSWIRKHSTKKLMRARYRCCCSGALLK